MDTTTTTRTGVSVRILDADVYLAKPCVLLEDCFSTFRNRRAVGKVPIIRIYGVTPAGQKICAHIHNVFPYFYVPWWRDDAPSHAELLALATKIDDSLQRHIQRPKGEAAASKGQQLIIARIQLVERHLFTVIMNARVFFLQIFLYNPFLLTKAAELMHTGAVDERRHQPYEAHIPYLLQFMTDFNLQGMNFIHATSCFFREPLPSSAGLPDPSSKTFYTRESVDPVDINTLSRSSKCALEVDIDSAAIVNQMTNAAPQSDNQLPLPANPGLTALWEDERLRRRARGQKTQFTPDANVERDVTLNVPFQTRNEQHWQQQLKAAIEIDHVLAASFPSPIHSLQHSTTNLESTTQTAQGINLSQTSLPAIDALAALMCTPDSSFADVSGTTGGEWDLPPELEDEHLYAGDSDFLDMDEDDESQLMTQAWDAETTDDQALNQWEDFPVGADQSTDTLVAPVPLTNPPSVHSKPQISLPHPNEDEPLSSRSFEDLASNLTDCRSTATLLSLPLHQADALFQLANLSPPPNPSMQKDLPSPSSPSSTSPPSLGSSLSDITAPTRPSPRRPFRVLPLAPNSPSTRNKECRRHVMIYRQLPPSRHAVEETAPPVLHQGPYFSDEADDIGRTRTITGARATFYGPTGAHLSHFPPMQFPRGLKTNDEFPLATRSPPAPTAQQFPLPWIWVSPVRNPPNRDVVVSYFRGRRSGKRDRPAVLQQRPNALVAEFATGSSVGTNTVANTLPSDTTTTTLQRTDPAATRISSGIHNKSTDRSFNFAIPTQNLSATTSMLVDQKLTLCSVELHADSRLRLHPHPREDAVRMIVCIMCQDDNPGTLPLDYTIFVNAEGIKDAEKHCATTGQLLLCSSEVALFEAFISHIFRYDPDFLIGYEVQRQSWGYLFERGKAIGCDLPAELSRLYGFKTQETEKTDPHRYNARHTSELKVPGRIILNLWRLLRHEMALQSYAFENLAFHVLHLRTAKLPPQTLSMQFFDPRTRWKTVKYFKLRALANLQLLYELNFIERTSEFARLFGILFNEVLTRGSQFRVESIMVRIAHNKGQIMLSPVQQQVMQQAAAEAQPLILEPQSAFYTSPVVVLDFQSLYPSMMIAYNMCFSTCLGKVRRPEVQRQQSAVPFGVSELYVPPGLLARLAAKNQVTITPNGVMFVKQDERKGVLPTMLSEILNTRIMVKKAMKTEIPGQASHRLMNARQLGLKLIANVTYGYTSASFSGRMPCVDIADSIVQQGRETLTKAMRMVEANAKWNAKVVYGDTDSMFVLLPGRSREEAFRIGREIAADVTRANPAPVKLKFEKVYMPCILQTKKRYVGHMYESEDQDEPVLESKGIETVRRDSCPAVGKILAKSLQLLFYTKDITRVKLFLSDQWKKIHAGRVNLTDFIIAREYRGRESYSDKACVAALEIANKVARFDPRAEPLVRERVPYVIVNGPPKATLISLVRQPHELLEDPGLKLNATYYIQKQIIPPLERCFNLLGVRIEPWYRSLPKMARVSRAAFGQRAHSTNTKSTLSQFYASAHCVVCDRLGAGTVCAHCRGDLQSSAIIVNARLHARQKRFSTLVTICAQCTQDWDDHGEACVSDVCPVRFERVAEQQRLDHLQAAVDAL